jgi:hypothetical protein
VHDLPQQVCARPLLPTPWPSQNPSTHRACSCHALFRKLSNNLPPPGGAAAVGVAQTDKERQAAQAAGRSGQVAVVGLALAQQRALLVLQLDLVQGVLHRQAGSHFLTSRGPRMG